jgi:NTP pyrophosphatase (non-canonical NTP hydrolase)
MDLAALTEKALLLHQRFGEAARASGGREWSREEVMQGFVGDVGDLMKLVMAKSGIRDMGDADKKLGHELADCLWSVLVLAKLYGINLEREFLRMLEDTLAKNAAGRIPIPAEARQSQRRKS